MTTNPEPRVLIPLDGSPLAEAVIPVVQGLGSVKPTYFRAGDDGRLGSPADEILHAAKRDGVDLIAMTTHGRSGFDRWVLGSVAEKVIRAASVPVLALRAEEPAATGEPVRIFARPLIAHDGSELADRAIDLVARIAPPGTAVTLFGVVETWDPLAPEPAASPPTDLARRFLWLRCNSMREDLERAAARARERGLEAQVLVEVGRPAARIVAAAEALPASLIALGTHGRSGLSRWALGSVTEMVLRAARVPLLICR